MDAYEEQLRDLVFEGRPRPPAPPPLPRPTGAELEAWEADCPGLVAMYRILAGREARLVAALRAYLRRVGHVPDMMCEAAEALALLDER